MSLITKEAVVPDRKSWQLLIGVQIAALFALGLYCTIVQRYLYADGSHFFVGLLRFRKFSEYFPARQYAHVLMQYPAIVLLQSFECRDVGLIGFMYGATLFLIPVGGLALTWWAAWKAPGYYLAIPSLAVSIMFMDSSLFIISEIHVAVALFWPILYLLVFSNRLTFVRSSVLVALAVAATRSYECYLFLAWPLIFVAARRAWAAWSNAEHQDLIVCTVSVVLFLTAFVIALTSVLVPQDAGSRSNFVGSMIWHLDYMPVQFSIVIIVSVICYAFFPGWVPARLVWCIALIFGAVVVIAPVVGFHKEWAFQYLSRVQGFYVPLLFGTIVAINPPALRSSSTSSAKQQMGLWQLAALTCLVSVLFQGSAAIQWNNYRMGLLHDLSLHRGVVRLERPINFRYDFKWDWAMPSLCVALSALNFGSVEAILCDPEAGDYQPFDPYDPKAIPDLSEYRIRHEIGATLESAKVQVDDEQTE